MIVLIAYATKHGATERIAERIDEVLSDAGIATTLLPVSLIKDISAYDAVVLGSAIYDGRWRESATEFLAAFEQDLAERKVWLFSSGPTGDGEPAELLEGWALPEDVASTASRIEPIDVRVFRGAIDIDRLSAAERLIIKSVRTPVGDFRDWRAITEWADSIVDEVSSPMEAPI